ncbi:ADP-ribosylglycohydrolase family protein [Paraphoma chrysanthemicola]|uniref:ADP-ribosylhydrolase ARH3 n=1 Tax=Paraphoma chrysanthemicola TaxID=798071 RepID=A0A8K0R1V5_9PLEO|nr:ADP-ribosylglycohydrolase family protein [Paraphoma chrysanthemicola]
MTSPNDQRTSRILGALLGVHTGDSLGATLEFSPWSDIIREYPTGLREIIGGGPFNWRAGHATDDTDLTRAVLLAYRDYSEHSATGSKRAFNIAKCAAEYSLKWYEGDWPGRKKGSRPEDIGNATRVGIQEFRRTKNPAKCGAGQGSAGNGSLMRCIPTGLFGSPETRRDESLAISAFTHNDTRCTVACAAYNEIVAALVEGKDVKEAVRLGKEVARELGLGLGGRQVVEAIEEGEGIQLAIAASLGPHSEFGVSASGYVLASLKLAIAAVLDSRSFEDVLVDVVRIGGDTDTNGAIAGGLLGARDGVEEIPERWLRKLQFRKEFEEVARRIIELHSGSA